MTRRKEIVMKKFRIGMICFAACAAMLLAGCFHDLSSGSDDDKAGIVDPQEPAFSLSRFSSNSSTIDNEYLPFTPGMGFAYEGESHGGENETIEIFVSHETKEILGIECAIVVDRAYEDGELIEETFDWYAQDDEGNIWYMGEDSAEFEDGEIVGKSGSWEAGVDGAAAGIIMKATPAVGDSYQQEFYEGEAEDMAKVEALNVSVTLSDGTEYETLKTLEWNPLEEDSEEYKYYASGVGLVLEEKLDGGEMVELVEIRNDASPIILAEDFEASTTINNQYFPLIPGTIRTYEIETDEGLETTVVEVLAENRQVMGIDCVVVRDSVFLDGDLIEDTRDWFAQDNDGNVWYFGEESAEYEDGEIVSVAGSWESGKDVAGLGSTASPGIVMKAAPRVGDSYRQEYYRDEAEDMAAVVALDAEVILDDGIKRACLKTREWTPLTPDAIEFKYYAPGIGLVREESEDGKDVADLRI